MPVYTVNRRRAIVLLVLSSILLLTLDLRGNPLIDRTRSAFSEILTPFEKAGDVIATPIKNMWHGATDYEDLERENAELRDQLAQLKGNDLTARASIADLQDLLILNGLTASYPTVTARVVGGAPGNFEQTVEIDRGSNDAIAVGMAVVNGGGLVGKITKVYRDRSVVRLVTDSDYAVECKVLGVDQNAAAAAEAANASSTTTEETTPSGEKASDLGTTTTTEPPTTTSTTLVPPDSETGGQGGGVEGEDTSTTTGESTTTVAPTTTTSTILAVRETGGCKGRGVDALPAMQYVSENQALGPIEIGDVITTTGGSTSLAPPDIPIGEVINIVRRTGSTGPVLEIKLGADLNHLNFVQVIRYVPPNEVPG